MGCDLSNASVVVAKVGAVTVKSNSKCRARFTLDPDGSVVVVEEDSMLLAARFLVVVIDSIMVVVVVVVLVVDGIVVLVLVVNGWGGGGMVACCGGGGGGGGRRFVDAVLALRAANRARILSCNARALVLASCT